MECLSSLGLRTLYLVDVGSLTWRMLNEQAFSLRGKYRIHILLAEGQGVGLVGGGYLNRGESRSSRDDIGGLCLEIPKEVCTRHRGATTVEGVSGPSPDFGDYGGDYRQI